MITDLIYTIAVIPLYIIGNFLTGISSVFATFIPDALYNAFNTFLSYLGYFNGIFPVNTLFQVMYVLMIFFTVFYIIKIALWVWSLLPFIGKKSSLPTLDKN